jgi:CubicO group peptidase (beta-lactamase class C family)
MPNLPLHPAALAVCALATLAPAQEPSATTSPAMLDIAAAYAAKVAASALFVSGRTLQSVLDEEFAPDRPLEAMIRPLLKFDVDTEHRTVTCRLGKSQAQAVATTNLGCTLVRPDVPAATLTNRAAPGVADLQADPSTTDWPLGERVLLSKVPDAVDLSAVAKALDLAFAEPAKGNKVRTRAVVVVHRGRLVAERYAEGYRADMPLPGWSMTKTMVDALLGVRVMQGRLDLLAPLRAVPEWPTDDARSKLCLADLHRMASGLHWTENYDDPSSSVLQMLFGSSDHAAVQAQQPAEHAPGTTYRYASGTTNLICRELRRTFASDAEYWAFPRTALFQRLGMRSAVIETDPSGTFVGSSYGFATARDWARFGMLYAQDGVFAGERILPEGWVTASAALTPTSDGDFGRHLWLNADPDGEGPRERAWRDLPANLVHMDGHEGQYVCVMPTEQIVVVRLGCAKRGGFDLHGLLRRVRDACTQPK